MSYKNARDVLPEPLLRQLQRYVEGEILYVPIQGKKLRWGERSGARLEIHARNKQICADYLAGNTIDELAVKYHLSVESIRKIVRKRRE